MTLEGRIALVTGGGGQLGRVIVRRLVRQGAGVFVAGRTPLTKGALGGEARKLVRMVRADVSVEGSVDRLFKTIANKEGRVDILVNCAGGFAFTGPFAGTPVKAWDRMMSANLRSVFLCCRAFLRQKGLDDYGRIVNFTAQTFFRMSHGRAPYAVAKGGVAMLTELLGEEFRGSGITVNAIAPSIIRTPENLKAMPGADVSAWVDPEEIASEVLHLCGPSAAAINGAIIPMFGGVKA